MGWTNIDLTTINPQAEIIPENTYTFELATGAKYNDRDPGKVDASATIVNDGDFTGRRLFFSYPDPAQKDWSPKALKRLEIALGVDALPGEDPVQYLNRAAGNRFTGKVTHMKPTEEYPNPKANLQLFSVSASA